jgi:hypothetical protein
MDTRFKPKGSVIEVCNEAVFLPARVKGIDPEESIWITQKGG